MIIIGKLTYLSIDKQSFDFIRSDYGSIDYQNNRLRNKLLARYLRSGGND